ncbi:MAG: PssE/Cps14G family polysaccharide biosynthesis glycosyltransferase [Candidatus Aenigmatarchaeota archaeon]
MIFVTVGTPKYDFSRLIKKMDEVAKKKNIFMQIGNTKYVPVNCKYKRFLSRKEFENRIKKSEVIVTHAGVGSIIDVLNAKKPIVVVPRRKKLGEHVNDHQMDITKEFEKRGLIIACYDVSGIEHSIRKSRKLKPPKRNKERERLLNTLETFLKGVKI